MHQPQGGYFLRYLKIDLGAQRAEVLEVEERWAQEWVGGRGWAARYLWEHLQSGVNPLDADNPVAIFAGPFTGTPLPGACKLLLATLSPETGIYTCSNAGGRLGYWLRSLGYDGVVICGEAEQPVYLVVGPGKIQFNDARELWGKTTQEVQQVLAARLGKEVSLLSIGPAGENKVAFACLQSDGRSFGRGGAGAVLGAKKLKALAVLPGKDKVPLHRPDRLNEMLPHLRRQIVERNRELHEFGRAALTDTINQFGCYPTRNFRSGTFEGVASLSGKAFKQGYFVRYGGCHRCPVACWQLCEVKDEPWKGTVVDPEYETIWAYGAHCGNADPQYVLRANFLADALGLDTISSGQVIGLAMDLFERGVIGRADADGLELRFGNGEAILRLLQMIARRQGLGEVLAQGFRGMAKAIPQSEYFMMHSKWLPFSAYEPRGFYGMALAFGTSSRGACHNVGGWTIRDELQSGKYDRFALEGKGRLVKRLQDTRAIVDAVGICTAVRSPLGFSDDPNPELLETVTGLEFDPLTAGEKIYNLERLLLCRFGIDVKDDLMPPRLHAEVLPDGPAQGRPFTAEMYREMLAEYYRERGWDENGRPTAGKLQELGIEVTNP